MDQNKRVLVIVESPTKAKTISRFLPEGYNVQATVGHIRDLPQSARDIPEDMKKHAWTRLGIDVENNFRPLYVLPKTRLSVIKTLQKEIKNCNSILLATDEDREGESICWHLLEVLEPKKEVQRIVFHEITKSAISNALKTARDINMQLVRAQETRRILDRLYGYTLSPLIWKKIAYGLSAGRVQSPALRLITERERERISFQSNEYWDIKAQLSNDQDVEFHAFLFKVDDKAVVTSKHFNSTTGIFIGDESVVHLKKEETAQLCKELQDVEWIVTDLTSRESSQRPSPPFITATLQQEGNRKLNFSTRQTMRTAQRLYEKGLITYMRTDSPTLSQEAIRAARNAVLEQYGEQYLSPHERQYTSRSRQSQEAHEAIRPAGSVFFQPGDLSFDSTAEKNLYTMIYRHTLASQMADAKRKSYSLHIKAGRTVFKATASVIVFPGFLQVNKVRVQTDQNPAGIGTIEEKSKLNLLEIQAQEHHTKAPARFTEASLVQKLESMDIGRPSTYSNIISTLYERKYAQKQDNAIIPTFTGIAVIQLLEEHFKYLVEYQFTSEMEQSLDKIANGTLDATEYLQNFYLNDTGLKHQVEIGTANIAVEPCRIIRLPYKLQEGTEIRIGRFGPYVATRGKENKEFTFSLPQNITPESVNNDVVNKLAEIEKKGPVEIGVDPESGKTIYCMHGRYGHHLQLGGPEEEKPRRASLSIPPEELTLEHALRLLSLPRVLGTHPTSGKEVRASIGPYGPYIVHDGDFRSLNPHNEDVYTIGFERALEILAMEKKFRRRRKST